MDISEYVTFVGTIYSTDMSDVWGGSSLSREEGSAGGICDDLDSGMMMMMMTMMMIDQVQAYKL
jgi:hypothetical protein